MFLFSEFKPALPSSASERDMRLSTEAARVMGWRVFTIPPDFSECEDADGALWQVPAMEVPTPAVWLGYIPDAARYQSIFEAARARNVHLLNTHAQFQKAMEFDQFYPFIEELTPRSLTVSEPSEALEAAQQIGYPIFLKGAIQGRKSHGWKACVAEDEGELQARVSELLELENRSRGRVVLREVVKLRHTRKHNDFPLGREYRVMMLNGEVLDVGYYWQGDDELKALTVGEHHMVEDLASEAARRLEVPYLAVDIGQLENGQWTIIEVGDAQFCGLCEIEPLRYWQHLKIALENSEVQSP